MVSPPKNMISLTNAARALRIRYQVAKRLVQSGKMRAVRIDRFFFIERREIARVSRERPWSPWAMRRYRR